MKRYGLDSVQSWIIVGTVSLIRLVTFGVNIGSAGILFVALMEENDITRRETSWPFSVKSGMGIFSGPLTVFLNSRLSKSAVILIGILLFIFGTCISFISTNIYFIIITIGVISGLGEGISMIMIRTFINLLFKKHKAMAMGIAMASSSVCAIIFSFIVPILLEEYTLKGTFLIKGGFGLHGLIAVAVMYIEFERVSSSRERNVQGKVKSVDEVTTEIDCSESNVLSKAPFNPPVNTAKSIVGNEESSDYNKTKTTTFDLAIVKTVFTSRGFYLIIIMKFVQMFLVGLIGLIIVDYATDKGIPYNQSLYIIPVRIGGQIIGQLGLSWVADRFSTRRERYLCVVFLLLSGLAFGMPFSSQIGSALVIYISFGILMGNLFTLTSVLFSDFFREKEILMAVSMEKSLTAIVPMLRSILIGVFRDGGGSYDNLFRFAGSLTLLLACMWFRENFLKCKTSKKQLQESSV